MALWQILFVWDNGGNLQDNLDNLQDSLVAALAKISSQCGRTFKNELLIVHVGCHIAGLYCVPNQCLNGATCEEVTDDFNCVCPSAFTGDLCQTRKLWPFCYIFSMY